MRKFVLFLFSLTILTSCNIEDIDSLENMDSLNSIDLDITGIWKLTQLNVNTALDINGDSVFSKNLKDETGIIDAILTFDSDSNGTIFYRSWIGFSSTESEGKLLFLPTSSLSSDHAPEPFDYTIENNKAVINTDISFNKNYTSPSRLEVIDNQLQITISNGFIVKDEITFEESVNQDLTYIFTKQ